MESWRIILILGNRKGCPYEKMNRAEPYRYRATARVAPTKNQSFCHIDIGQPQGLPLPPYPKWIMTNNIDIGQPQGLPLRKINHSSISISGNHKGCLEKNRLSICIVGAGLVPAQKKSWRTMLILGNHKGCPYPLPKMNHDEPYRNRATARVAPAKNRRSPKKQHHSCENSNYVYLNNANLIKILFIKS